MPIFRGELREEKAGTQRSGGTYDRITLQQGPIGTWVQVEGVKGGERNGIETASDAGTQSGAQGRTAEAGGRRVRATLTSRWVALRTRR